MCDMTIKSDGSEATGTLVGTLDDVQSSAGIASRKPLGVDLSIKLEYIDLGNQRYRWRQNVLEIAARHPTVPMVLAKMGRGFRTSFDTCMVVALRNANVYLEMTDAPSEHIREAVEKVGAHRIMFGTDLSAVSTNYSLDLGFRDLNGANLKREDVEWICWRTANEVYKLGLDACIKASAARGTDLAPPQLTVSGTALAQGILTVFSLNPRKLGIVPMI